MDNAKEMAKTSIWVPRGDYETMQKLCKETGVTTSAVIRQLLKRFVEATKKS